MERNLAKDGFFFGVNYWASHAGTYMWRDWRADVVQEDFKKLAGLGVKVLRVFPLWPDFQPLTALLTHEGKQKELTHGDTFLDDSTEEGRAGVSVSAMEKFEEFCRLANQYGFKLIVSLINGWMSARCFFPEAFIGKNAIKDPLCVRWEIRFVKYFVNKFKNKKHIIAWEAGNECNCLGRVDSVDEAYVWASTINDAIRSQDSTRPILSGMHSLATRSAWTIKDQAELCDVLTIHPYLLFTDYCMLDKMVSPRGILHSPAEQTLYEDIGGKECFVEEIGTLGPIMGCDEDVASFVRANLFNAWAHGSAGLLWWTGFDQSDLVHAPYDWADCERELGIFRTDGSEKPLAGEIRKFNDFLSKIPYRIVPERNRDATCLIMPDDWSVAFGAFMLAKRAGFEIQFFNKESFPEDADFYIIPGVYSCDLRKRIFDVLLKKVEVGATLLFSYDKELLVPFEPIIGCKSHGRHVASTLQFTMAGERFSIDREYTVALEPTTAEVILRDDDGNPILTKNKYGKGKILFFNGPLELYFAKTAGVCLDNRGFEKIYQYAVKEAGLKFVVQKKNVHTSMTVHKVTEGKYLVVAINNTPTDIQERFVLNGARIGEVYYGEIDKESAQTTIFAANAVVFEVICD